MSNAWRVSVTYEGACSHGTKEFSSLEDAATHLAGWEPLEGKFPLEGQESYIVEQVRSAGFFRWVEPDVDYMDDSAYLGPIQ